MGILDAIVNWFCELLYYLGIFFCTILRVLYQLFEVYSGIKKVRYGNTDDYLMNIFFSNSTITTIYAGMALIGIVLLFTFTILAVTRKAFDLGDRMQQPMGEILRKTLTCGLFIICMNFIMMVTVNVSNTLLQSITYLFNNAYAIQEQNEITFGDQHYAAMARVYDTIGNYSLNPSYNSRYNLNSCYNDIRSDMAWLESENVFRFTYKNETEGQDVDSWQSVLCGIARSHDLSEDQPLDEYDPALSAALKEAINYIRINKMNSKVHTEYKRTSVYSTSDDAKLDVFLWLAASTDAAKNRNYNGENSSFDDPVRGAYVGGSRSIYNIGEVEEDFSLGLDRFNHLIVILGGMLLCVQFLRLLVNCIARIFNMMLLYVMAPPFIATGPFDDGSKFRQWCTAFVIQSFNVFGTIISVRLMIMMLPVIFDARLQILGGGFAGAVAKILLVFAAAYTATKASGLISGILSENAGYQSILAGDVASQMRQGTPARMMGTAGSIGAGAMRMGRALGGKALASPFQAARYGYNRSKASSLAKTLDGTGRAGSPEKRVEAARGFLSLNRDEAKKKYGMNDKRYDSMRNRAENVMEQHRFGSFGGRSGGGAGGGGNLGGDPGSNPGSGSGSSGGGNPGHQGDDRGGSGPVNLNSRLGRGEREASGDRREPGGQNDRNDRNAQPGDNIQNMQNRQSDRDARSDDNRQNLQNRQSDRDVQPGAHRQNLQNRQSRRNTQPDAHRQNLQNRQNDGNAQPGDNMQNRQNRRNTQPVPNGPSGSIGPNDRRDRRASTAAGAVDPVRTGNEANAGKRGGGGNPGDPVNLGGAGKAPGHGERGGEAQDLVGGSGLGIERAARGAVEPGAHQAPDAGNAHGNVDPERVVQAPGRASELKREQGPDLHWEPHVVKPVREAGQGERPDRDRNLNRAQSADGDLRSNGSRSADREQRRNGSQTAEQSLRPNRSRFAEQSLRPNGSQTAEQGLRPDRSRFAEQSLRPNGSQTAEQSLRPDRSQSADRSLSPNQAQDSRPEQRVRPVQEHSRDRRADSDQNLRRAQVPNTEQSLDLSHAPEREQRRNTVREPHRAPDQTLDQAPDQAPNRAPDRADPVQTAANEQPEPRAPRHTRSVTVTPPPIRRVHPSKTRDKQ